jgi:hypothetical protein
MHMTASAQERTYAPSHSSLASRSLLAVQLSPFAEVRLEALPAPPLVTVLVAVEGFEWQRLFAPLAATLVHERMFARESDGKPLWERVFG